MATAEDEEIELGETKVQCLEGFSEFSEFISSDGSLSLYRRFGTLGARNLLYLQAELHLLESQLRALDNNDSKVVSQPTNNREKELVDDAARSWESFQAQAQARDSRQVKKMEVVLKIRTVMKEYGMQKQIHTLNSEVLY
jgi:hypothetical protein